MCGISAIISSVGIERLPNHIAAMTKTVQHRGPDDEGYVFFYHSRNRFHVLGGNDTPEECYKSGLPYCPRSKIAPSTIASGPMVAFGHRRLSILDISAAGHQPMCSVDQRHWIVYNGEIYNYIELRDELKNSGHDFSTQSDTEVILKAYQQWGETCLDRFNGMFALVIFDRETERIFMARDRFGIKPLYWWTSSEGFIAIASEIKQFTVLPGWRSRLNAQCAYDYLNWGICDHTSETLFSGVHQLRGGEYADLSLKDPSKGIHPQRWFNLNPQVRTIGKYSAAETFRELFTDSIRLRLRSDVPVGSCLSGGLDSSSIVCVVNSLLKSEGMETLQKTFSARLYNSRFDEGEYIEAVISKTGAQDHHVYPELNELFNELDSLVWHQDEPFNSSSVFAQWMVFRLAAENGVKVMLDGQGADELLAGYDGYTAARFAGLFKRLKMRLLFQEIQLTSRNNGLTPEILVKKLFNHMMPERVRQPFRKFSGKASTHPKWLNLDRLNIDAIDPFSHYGSIGASVTGLSISQLTRSHLPMLLHWEDRDSMAHSVESRVPFLDYRLVNFIVSLPEEYKISAGVSKQLLRKAMNGLLPEKIRMRMDKIGFVTPEEMWVKEEASDTFRHKMRRAIEASQGVINHNAEKKLENMIIGKEPYDYIIWRLICFGSWMERFNVTVH